jgi:hypothetical protein
MEVKLTNTTTEELMAWRLRMNWASDGERYLFLLAAMCCLLLAPLGIASLGLKYSLLLLVSHTVLLLFCSTCIGRRFSIVSNIIVIASLANFLLAQFSGLQHAELLIFFFCGLALLSLPFSLYASGKAQRLARAALDYSEKDQYRWLLTSAPLLYRWKFSELLQSVPEAS